MVCDECYEKFNYQTLAGVRIGTQRLQSCIVVHENSKGNPSAVLSRLFQVMDIRCSRPVTQCRKRTTPDRQDCLTVSGQNPGQIYLGRGGADHGAEIVALPDLPRRRRRPRRRDRRPSRSLPEEAPSKAQRSSPFPISPGGGAVQGAEIDAFTPISFHMPPDTGDVPGGGTETLPCFVRFDFLHTEPQCGGSQKGHAKGPRYDVGFHDFNGLI
ncbi:hypothetical protein KP79_PYT12638 [Mizuhopecten yessoensis]|uniref:Uncharacterized protein n=1 Tax=Mizuhopecten yessoensis TaxID=6573 RepID=A0A210Q4V2_MIZYE|nr:hypothetical protein KP79_PYT12638 [Mizuhopecten yessoensis]